MSLDMDIDLVNPIRLNDIAAGALSALEEILNLQPPGSIVFTQIKDGKESTSTLSSIGLSGQMVLLGVSLSGSEGKVFLMASDLSAELGVTADTWKCPRGCMVSISGDCADSLVLGAAVAITIARITRQVIGDGTNFPGVTGNKEGEVLSEDFLAQVRLPGQYPDFATAAKAFHAKVWSEWRRTRGEVKRGRDEY